MFSHRFLPIELRVSLMTIITTVVVLLNSMCLCCMCCKKRKKKVEENIKKGEKLDVDQSENSKSEEKKSTENVAENLEVEIEKSKAVSTENVQVEIEKSKSVEKVSKSVENVAKNSQSSRQNLSLDLSKGLDCEKWKRSATVLKDLNLVCSTSAANSRQNIEMKSFGARRNTNKLSLDIPSNSAHFEPAAKVEAEVEFRPRAFDFSLASPKNKSNM